MKKRIYALFLSLTLLFGMTGCSLAQSQKIAITMHLWDKSMCKELTPWLEETFPDIDFTFVVGYNTMDYYSDLNARGNLPDIITCRRFSLNDAAHMSEYLMDLSTTEVVGTFYDNYIENNRETNGAIRWLPMCAEVDGYIANLDVFAEYNVPIPTNYAEFKDAMQRFEEAGIIGYINDYKEDYSCMQALQGCAIPQLMTIDGMMWRMQYESETDDHPVGLNETVWIPVFEKFERYLLDTYVKPENADLSLAVLKPAFLEGKAAIMRGTANDCQVLRDNGMNCIMLPYFGESAEDNWLLTYPTLQVAVNQVIEGDSRKKEAVIRVLNAMFSEEGQHKASPNSAVLSYSKNVNMEFSEVFSMVEDCISRNHLYIRLASTEMFSVSRDVVQKMIRAEYDAKGAYADFQEQLIADKTLEAPEIITTQTTEYPYLMKQHGIPAVSSYLNTVHKQMGGDVVIGYSSIVTAPVYAGTYTAQQLKWLIANRTYIREGELTGEELVRLMEWLVNTKEDGSNPIRHKNLIPAASGMTYTMTDNGDGTYTLGDLKINGAAVDRKTVYSVIMLGDNNFIEAEYLCNCPMPDDLKEKMVVSENQINDIFIEAMTGGNSFEAPSDYVTILK